MKLTISDLSKILDVPLKTVYQLINKEGIPTFKVMEQAYIEPLDFLDWCITKNIQIKYNILQNDFVNNTSLLSEAMLNGKSFHIEDKGSIYEVMESIIEKFPTSINKDLIFKILFNKQGIKPLFTYKNEIVIPYLKTPIITNIEKPEVWLFYLTDYINIGSKFIHTWFFIFSPTVIMHYQLVENLYRVLLNPAFYELIISHRDWAGVIYEEVKKCEPHLNRAFVNEIQKVDV